MDGAMGAAAQLQGFVSRRRALFREELAEWVRIPSIAADPERVEAVHRSAAYLAGAVTLAEWGRRLPASFR